MASMLTHTHSSCLLLSLSQLTNLGLSLNFSRHPFKSVISSVIFPTDSSSVASSAMLTDYGKAYCLPFIASLHLAFYIYENFLHEPVVKWIY